MLTKFVFVIGLMLSLNFIPSTLFAKGDAVKGKKTFNKCRACHAVKTGKHKVGPSLAGVVGRQAGKAPGFKRYKGLKKTDWKWNVNNLDGWLKNPKNWLKAKNGKRSSMVYKLKKKQDRDDIIAYLQTLK